MKLTKEETAILKGEQGPVLQKALQTIVDYGKVFGAVRLLPLKGRGHIVLSNGMFLFYPYFSIIAQCLKAGLKTQMPFTVNPRPLDHQSLKDKTPEILIDKTIYARQRSYEKMLMEIGLQDKNAFSCACYLPQVGNIPEEGAVVAWAESSAVVYANSVLGARTNRNSSGIDILSNLLGKTPEFGLLTDSGRKADWIINLENSKLPDPQLLGSAIGLKIGGAVPYINGLDRLLKEKDRAHINDYLKEMGAASASNGAVGLFHAENITPEAVKQKRTLLNQGYREYIIDDAELAGVYKKYPNLWQGKDNAPHMCIIGCPHLSLAEVKAWTNDIKKSLKEHNLRHVKLNTVICTAPGVIAEIIKNGFHEELINIGIKTTSLCPLMYLSNPLRGSKKVVTNSNKLRTYTAARFFLRNDLLEIICSGKT